MKVKLYNTYLFRDKDPVIDYLRTAKARTKAKTSEMASTSGVSSGTIANWFGGKTRKPQWATVVAVARAMGPEGTEALAQCLRAGGRKGAVPPRLVAQAGKRLSSTS